MLIILWASIADSQQDNNKQSIMVYYKHWSLLSKRDWSNFMPARHATKISSSCSWKKFIRKCFSLKKESSCPLNLHHALLTLLITCKLISTMTQCQNVLVLCLKHSVYEKKEEILKNKHWEVIICLHRKKICFSWELQKYLTPQPFLLQKIRFCRPSILHNYQKMI